MSCVLYVRSMWLVYLCVSPYVIDHGALHYKTMASGLFFYFILFFFIFYFFSSLLSNHLSIGFKLGHTDFEGSWVWCGKKWIGIRLPWGHIFFILSTHTEACCTNGARKGNGRSYTQRCIVNTLKRQYIICIMGVVLIHVCLTLAHTHSPTHNWNMKWIVF